MVIGLTGPKLAGKGTAALYITKKYGASVFSMSGILSDIASRIHVENSRSNLIAIATGLRSQYGEDILAHVLKKDIEKNTSSHAIIDGIRLEKEVEIFSTLPDFHLLYIDAPVELRYQRALQRGEKAGETEMTFEEFLQEETAVTETGITSLQKNAHTIFMNATSLEALYAQIDDFFES